jgi:pyrimidine/purine-5'-nucleotide nucleosidase
MEHSIILTDAVDARVGPRGSMENLSQAEISKLLDSSAQGLYPLFRSCALAVLNAGSESDDPQGLFERYRDFTVQIERHARGIKLAVEHAPAPAFVDGEMIRGLKEHLFAVLRDVIYTANEIVGRGRLDSHEPASITNAVFHILRNARLLEHKGRPNLAVLWGGHSIEEQEYQYTKRVGYELGLRGLDVCTGCGPGAMKGPMKGATIGHSKQRISSGRYIGVTEPGIIAAEPPNAIVNQLVIMPDIEKRLEAFVRVAHGIVIFPGGVGTAEELLYLLGILLEPVNAGIPLATTSTGCCTCRTRCSCPSSPRTRRCARSSCAASDHRTSSQLTCAAPSPASSRATSRRRASRRSPAMAPSSCMAMPRSCARSTACSRPSWPRSA